MRFTVQEKNGKIVLSFGEKKQSLHVSDIFENYQDISLIKSVSINTDINIEKMLKYVVSLDIETTGFNAETDRVLAIGIYCNGKFRHFSGDEKKLLTEFNKWIQSVKIPIILTGYNIFDFDIPFLIQRMKKHNIKFVLSQENTEVMVSSTNGIVKSEPLKFKKINCEKDNITLIDAFHLVCRYDFINRKLSGYNLKQVSVDLGVSVDNRVVVDRQNIQELYEKDKETFLKYLEHDCIECEKVFKKLILPYCVISKIVNISLDVTVIKSTAYIWEKIIENHYDKHNLPEPDQKKSYVGGLVIANHGYFKDCAKIDVASLYPNIMMNYRIHSKKDTEGYALSWLKTLTEKRLELKELAKKGDEKAKIIQSGLKVLINSLYGFYGTGGYAFNDMNAAEKITKMARKILTYMIFIIEEKGGVIVEADTDGVIFSHSEPEEVYKEVCERLSIYKFDLEWKNANVYVSDEKNYMVFLPDGKEIIKGGKWRGRDKEKLFTEVVIDLIKTKFIDDDLFDQKVKEIIKKLMTADKSMFKYLVKTVRVSRTDKTLHKYGYKEGDRVSYCYKDYKNKLLSFSEEEGYDFKYYCSCFMNYLKEISKNNRNNNSKKINSLFPK